MGQPKEALELIKAFEVLGVAGKKIGADGKVNLMDFPVLMDLFKDGNILIAGFQDVQKCKEELQHLSKEELQDLIAKLYDSAEKVRTT